MGNTKRNVVASTIDLKQLSEQTKKAASKAAAAIGNEAGKLRDKADETEAAVREKATGLDKMLEDAVAEYNDTYTFMNDKGIRLFVERNRAVDSIENVKNLVNSIANHPKEFDAEFEVIESERKKFKDTCEFADKEIKAARQTAGGVGAGMAAGASVAFMAPTAAMWIATTFGTASTGAAISTLSGAAATNAALAWLGGGALAAGGGGMAAGNALLALAGPIGWGVAGATLLTSIVLFAKKKNKINKEKSDEIEKIKKNTEILKEMDSKIEDILDRTKKLRKKIDGAYTGCLPDFGSDYKMLSDDMKKALGALVNSTKTLSLTLDENVGE